MPTNCLLKKQFLNLENISCTVKKVELFVIRTETYHLIVVCL